MNLSMSARPVPGTTELLEVLDRVLDGGLVIDVGPRLQAVGFGSSQVPTRLVIAGLEPRTQDAEEDGEPSGLRATLLVDEPPEEVLLRRHG